MGLKLADLAVRYGCELQGDPDIEVSGVATLQSSAEGCVSFLANPLYRKHLAETKASVVILKADDVEHCPVACLIAPDPYLVYAHIAAELHPRAPLKPGVHPAATVADTATVGEGSEIAAGAVIGENSVIGARVYVGPNTVVGDDCIVGDDSRLNANVTLYSNVRMGERCIIHSSAVLGADGFGIAQSPAGWVHVPQVGGVLMGNDVDVGANTAIDRGAIDDTRIGNGVKLDNQVQVGHNCVIGDHTVMAGQAGISGSSEVGSGCVIGGKTGIAGHLTVCSGVMLTGGCNVTKSITEPGVFSNILPAEDAGVWRKTLARIKRLDKTQASIKVIEKRLAASDNDADSD